MRAINQKATATFNKLIGKLDDTGHIKIGEPDQAFMQVVVEKLYDVAVGTVYSIAHYFKQNGDLCSDPDMTFLKHSTGKIYPMSFQQAIPPVYQESMFMEGIAWKVCPPLQKEHAVFAGQWFENIKHQQEL